MIDSFGFEACVHSLGGFEAGYRCVDCLREDLKALRAQGVVRRQPTRLEAAEREVIRAAIQQSDSARPPDPKTGRGCVSAKDAWTELHEAVDRLLALRAEIEEKQPRCEAATTIKLGPPSWNLRPAASQVQHVTMLCELPVGHDGEHLARPDGEWRWG